MTLKELTQSWRRGDQLMWNDPQPIEGNDYIISYIEELDDLEESDSFLPILIQYNKGQSEAQVYLHEIIKT